MCHLIIAYCVWKNVIKLAAAKTVLLCQGPIASIINNYSYTVTMIKISMYYTDYENAYSLCIVDQGSGQCLAVGHIACSNKL